MGSSRENFSEKQPFRNRNMDQKRLQRMVVLFIGSIQGLLYICGTSMMMVLISSVQTSGACQDWVKWVLGRVICDSAASFRLTIATFFVLSLVGVVCGVMLLKGVLKGCRDDLLPWLIANGTVIPVSLALTIQQMANNYIADSHVARTAEFWLYYSIYWAVNIACLAIVAREYNRMGPSKKERQFEENIKYISQNINPTHGISFSNPMA